MSDTFSLADVQNMQAGGGEVYSLDAVRAMSAPRTAPKGIADRMYESSFGPALFKALAGNLGTPQGNAEALDTFVGGPLRAAAGIGSTLLYPVDKAMDLIQGDRGQTPGGRSVPSRNEERRASIDQFFRENFNPESPSFKGAKLGTEIAGTLGVGPALGATVRALPIASPALTAFGNALASGGMSTGASTLGPVADLGIRAAGSAVAGGAATGLVDPASAGTAALISGTIPLAARAVNAAGTAGAQMVRNVMTKPDVRAARDIAAMAGADPSDLAALARLRDTLRQPGPEIIGGQRTVPEILQSPEISQLQRTVGAVQSGPMVQRAADREAARREVLERIAPIANRSQTAQEVGNAITEYAIPAERQASRRVSELFNSVPPEEAMMHLPLQQMQQAQTRYVGPGSFGAGRGAVEDAMQAATNIGMNQASLTPRVVPFDQIQSLRSSIGEAISEARRAGRNQSAAALTQMKAAIDNKVAEVAMGNAAPGEVFTPQAVDAWGQALAAHSAKKLQFNTGPQAALFRRGSDGLPLVQGAEVPGRFFNASPSQVSDAQSFRRLVADDPNLVGELRRYALSDAAGQTNQLGNLSPAKFNKWLDARAGATGEIFTDQQRAWLRAIGDDLRRSALAESLGRSTGSDTMQKAASMMRLGMVDNPAARWAASRIPLGSQALDFMSGPLRAARAERIGGLLMDPERTAGLLDTFIATRQPAATGGLLGAALAENPALLQSAPLLLTAPQR